MKYENLSNHGVVAVVIKNNKYLLLEDSKKPMRGCWAPPHGKCEAVDSCEEDCVVREVLEESNLNVKPIRKLWTTEADTKVETVSFWLVEVVDGEIKINKRESSNYGWFSLDEALKLKLYPGTKRFFGLVRKEKIKT